MPQFAWPAFTGERKDRHLVVLDVPARVSAELAAVVRCLISRLQPDGDFALSSEETADGTTVFCAFARSTDAENMIDAVSAHEDNRHPGWASEYHCVIDETAAKAIADTGMIKRGS
jgi:pyruvoyl-dependent arginine decarboxylase (PvlArgDC)